MANTGIDTFSKERPEGARVYTAFISFGWCGWNVADEEIDVWQVGAFDKRALYAEVERELAEGYETGGKIIGIEERFGLFM